jgi:hypothetical protein
MIFNWRNMNCVETSVSQTNSKGIRRKRNALTDELRDRVVDAVSTHGPRDLLVLHHRHEEQHEFRRVGWRYCLQNLPPPQKNI